MKAGYFVTVYIYIYIYIYCLCVCMNLKFSLLFFLEIFFEDCRRQDSRFISIYTFMYNVCVVLHRYTILYIYTM